MHSGQSHPTQLTPLTQRLNSRQHLHGCLIAAFSLDELRQLCFECNVDSENIPHDTKGKLARGLIEHIEKRNDVTRFLEIVRGQRPEVGWPEFIQPQADPDSELFSATRAAYLDYVIARTSFAHLPIPAPTGLTVAELFVPPKLQRSDFGPLGATAAQDDPQPATPLADVIRSHPRLLIIGPKNSGKTTLLQFLVLHYAMRIKAQADATLLRRDDDFGPAKLPFLADLARITRAMMNSPALRLVEALGQALKPELMPHNDFDAWFKVELATGNAVLLFDGVNAAAHIAQEDGVVRALDDLLASIHPANRVIVVSRPRTDALTSAPLATFTLCDMDGAQTRQFVKQWLMAVVAQGDKNAQAAQVKRRTGKLLSDLRSTPALRHLAKMPGYLALLTMHAIKGLPLPQHRNRTAALVRQVLSVCLDDEPTRRLFPSLAGLGAVVCVNALSRLALWMHTNQRDTISEAQASEQIADLLMGESALALSQMTAQAHTQSIFKHLADHACLLSCLDSTGYQFAFPLLHDYLAGHALLQNPDAFTQIKAHRNDVHWRDAIASAIAQMSAKDPMLAQRAIQGVILEADAELASRHSLVLAAYCLAECDRGLDKSWLHSVAYALSELWLLASVDAQLNTMLADAFATLTGSELAEQLAACFIDMLGAGQASVIVRALDGLGQLSHSNAQVNRAVLQALSNSDALVRQTAAKTLGVLADHSPAAIQALAGALSDPDLGVKRSAITSLRYIAQPDDGVRMLLLQRLSDSKLAAVAAEALAAMYGANKALMDEAVGCLRNAATRNGGLALLCAVAVHDRAVVEHRVVGLSRDASPDVRKSAIWLMQRLDFASDAVIDALLTRLHDDKVRRSAAEALQRVARTNSARVIAGLHQLTEASDRYVRRVAQEMLEHIGAKV